MIQTPCLAPILHSWAVAAGVVALAILTVPFSLLGAGGSFTLAPLDFAAYATGTGCGALNLSGGAYTDSFDSSQGTYAQTKQLANGNVGVTGNATLSGQAKINGSIAALNTTVGACQNGVPGISPSGQAVVTAGYIRLTAAPPFPNPPRTTPGSSDVGITKNTSLSPGSFGNIAVSGGATLTLAPGTYYINSVTLSGGSIVTVSPPGQVVIQVAGNNLTGNKAPRPINLSGGRIVNPSGIPLNFQLLYGGSLPVTLSGGSACYAIAYAPHSPAALSGGSDWYGVLVVGTLDDSGGTPIHYDRSLGVNPTITAAISPTPNAAGWNNSNVTVTFTCSDPVFAITSCTPPVQITTEGANQVVAGTAVNQAGFSSSTSVSVNLDKTPPIVAITSPLNGVTVNPGSITLTGKATDALSGIATVNCKGTAAVLSGSDFSCVVPVVVGPNTIPIQTMDKAGNTASASLLVQGGAAALTQISPNTAPQGKQNFSVAIAGQYVHFVQGTSTAAFGTGITVVSLAVNTPTSAKAILNIDPTTPIGSRNVTVTTGSEVPTLANGFTVTAGLPVLSSVNPSGGRQGQQNLPVTLVGQFTHFQQGSSQVNFGAGITVLSLTVGSPSNATAVLSIDPSAATGARSVTVTTGSEVVTLNNGFTVGQSTPISLLVSPNNGQQGQQNLSVTITGQSSHFVQGASDVSFGAGITVASLAVSSPTSAIAILNIAPGATLGGRTVTLATNGEVGTLNNGFTVLAAAPSLLSIAPNTGQQGQQNLPVVITGQFTHFLQGTTQANFGAGVSVASLTVNSPTVVTAILNIASGAATGARTVTLTTGTEAAALPNGFTVTSSAPVLFSVNPSNGQQGAQNLEVLIAGQFTHFVQGASQANFGAGVTVASLTVNSPTSVTAIITVDYSATAGPRTVTLTTGAEVVTLSNGFTVTVPTPVLVSVSPNSGQQGAQGVAVTVAGKFTHFSQGTTQTSFGAGITVASLTVNSFTSATAVLNIDPAAIPGSRPLTVVTGTETETLANAFTVTSGSIGITVTPNTWNFGNVPITTSPKQTFTITSSGTSPLTANSISISGPFFSLGGLPPLPLLLSPSGTATFTVSYAPLGTFASNATVTINSNAATSPTIITLTGTGTPAPQPTAGAITVRTDQSVYRRAQPVQISGTLTSTTGAGIPNIPVTVLVSVNGSVRTLNPFSDAQGNYQTTFLPAAADGGTFSVTASASSGGTDRTATTSFRIFGLLLNPSTLSKGLVMGNTLAVPLDLLNVGDAALNNVTYSAVVTPSGSLSATFPQSVGTLAAGAAVTIPAVLTAPAGDPPPIPVTVRITITAADSITAGADPESTVLTITLLPSVSTLVLTPPTLSVGVNPGGSLTRRFVVSNQGYATTNNSTVTLQDPVTFNWVSLGNANLGDLGGGTSKEFQVLINPPATLPLGNYTVLFNVSGGTSPLQGAVNISVTQSTLGAVSS